MLTLDLIKQHDEGCQIYNEPQVSWALLLL